MDQENRMPLIGDKAPSFEAVTTQGPIKFPEDYAGKWVILFSHPADFTPVCTTEFMTFGSMIDEFKALNTELVGLSVDSIYSHIAWLRKIQELEWNGKKHINVTFPLIEDIRMEVANKYGMIQPGQSNTQAVRAVFVIDPNGVVRTILYYPLSTGRNFDEIKRIILALQKADADACATPAEIDEKVALARREGVLRREPEQLGDPVGYISGLGCVEMPCDAALCAALADAAARAGIEVRRGLVASGDQFIASAEQIARIRVHFDAQAAEMEGGAIGQVCTANGVPFAVLRAISDGGNEEAKMSYPQFVQRASERSVRILMEYLQA